MIASLRANSVALDDLTWADAMDIVEILVATKRTVPLDEFSDFAQIIAEDDPDKGGPI